MKKDNINFKNGIIKSIPKKWTENDIKDLINYKKQGFNNNDIGLKMGRTSVSIGIKLKRLSKKNNTYNEKHILDKYSTNDLFITEINPQSILDVFAGDKYYKKFNIKNYITNDINGLETNYKMDAFDFLCLFKNKRIDIVDLDPFGSAFDCFDLAIKIAEKGLIITLGELGHRRFKRLDFVKNRYGIKDITEDWIFKIIDYIINRGLIYKKILTPVYIKDWNNIGRVYFKIQKYKETSQWNLD